MVAPVALPRYRSPTLTGDGVIFTWILPFVKMLLSPFKCDGTATLWDDDGLLSLLAAAFSRRGLREVSAAAERSGMEIIRPFEADF